MNRNQWLQKGSAATDAANAIIKTAKDAGRPMTDDEANQVEAHLAANKQAVAEIAKLDRQEQLEADAAGAALTYAAPGATPPPSPMGGAEGARDLKAEVGLPNLLSDRNFGMKGINHYLHEVARVANGKRSERLDAVETALKSIKGLEGGATFNGDEGGFLIAPPAVSDQVYKRAIEIMPFIDQCQKVIVPGNVWLCRSLKDGDRSSAVYRHGGIRVYWRDEGQSVEDSKIKSRVDTLKLHALDAMVYATEEELSDTLNYGDLMTGLVGQAYADEMLEYLLWGTGVGQPLGLLKSGACVEIDKETNQPTDTLVIANFIKMWAAIWGRQKCMWLYNADCLVQMMSLVVDTGAGVTVPVYLPPNGLSADPYDRIFGRQAYETDHCSAIGDAGDVALVDPSPYVVATKGSLIPEQAVSMHFKFDTHEQAFRFSLRFDGRLPWDVSITPRKGAIKRSPAVKLGAR